MTAWRSYARTALLTGFAMAGLVAVAWVRGPDHRIYRLEASPAEPVLAAAMMSGEAEGTRRLPLSAVAPDEILRPPPPSDVPPRRADPVDPVAFEDLTSPTAPSPRSAEVPSEGRSPAGDVTFARVEVIDGRSFMADGRRVRLAGLDLPPEGKSCPRLDGTDATCRARARTQLELFLRHRAVICRMPDADAQGPVEARCRVGRADVGEWLLRSGWAMLAPGAEVLGAAEAPDGGELDDARYTKSVAEARRRKAGLWN